MTGPFKVICINDQNKPKEVPESSWVVYGERYTVIKVDLLSSHKTIGFKLQEINLPDDAFPYEYFDAQRFIMSDDEEEYLMEQEINRLLNETRK